ncbi:hypothetical protein SJ05684_c06880 [Sinorhizobium sojae CCBAU 05684]|uniref:Uncharacterized protein n=1 Tax=Sinorhizobium sojae CCBAU 05684 TaxID=716928 RepID=A0A249P896_9HYPH|nr:hypothetical protein SJ05684_c06880 [Sinorhizobium sojae CCBAU 05684]
MPSRKASPDPAAAEFSIFEGYSGGLFTCQGPESVLSKRILCWCGIVGVPYNDVVARVTFYVH